HPGGAVDGGEIRDLVARIAGSGGELALVDGRRLRHGPDQVADVRRSPWRRRARGHGSRGGGRLFGRHLHELHLGEDFLETHDVSSGLTCLCRLARSVWPGHRGVNWYARIGRRLRPMRKTSRIGPVRRGPPALNSVSLRGRALFIPNTCATWPCFDRPRN